MSGAAVLSAACSGSSPQGPQGPATAAVLHEYGHGSYWLGTATKTYSAEVIVKPVRGGVAVLAAGGYLAISSGVCVPNIDYSFLANGRTWFSWKTPLYEQCPVSRLASGFYRVCIAVPGHQGQVGLAPAAAPGSDLIGGCVRPVIPLHASVIARLLSENKHGTWQAVASVSFTIQARSNAASDGQPS
jgi:hypothetical protein